CLYAVAPGNDGVLLFCFYGLPLLASCAAGVISSRVFSRPAATTRGWMALIATIAALLALEIEGSNAISRWLDSGESSDFTGPAAALAFVAFCIALAAPLSAKVFERGAAE